jgi:transposase
MDSPHVVAAVRVLSRLELVAEPLRAALNDLATVVPNCLQGLAPLEWYERYGKRIEEPRLPRETAAREASAQTVGEDGFRVLDALEGPEAPEAARELPRLATLRRTWQRHDERTEGTGSPTRKRPGPRVRFKANRDVPRAAEGSESPSDPDARYRHKRDPH